MTAGMLSKAVTSTSASCNAGVIWVSSLTIHTPTGAGTGYAGMSAYLRNSTWNP
ncbi:hypothetical protein RTZ71_22300 [Rhodococcus qingshengii]|nr:hypothetical protein [Rhodococcus qingshengii]MDT9663446.1 hypothetical protein [Rhodococcus qingshengii]